MKTLKSILAILAIAITFSACKKEDLPQEAGIILSFDHYVGETKIEANNTTQFTNAAGNSYSVSLLKYYISNIVLVDAQGNETAFQNHDLIDAFGKTSIPAYVIPNGDYVKMRFIYGVDAENNTSGDQAGDLDPSYGMFWSWATGYIFMKHEGKYLDNSNVEQNMEFHLGRQVAATDIEIDLTGLTMEGVSKEANIKFDLNNMYNDPVIDFNIDNSRHSTMTEATWITAMTDNLVDVFSYTGSSEL